MDETGSFLILMLKDINTGMFEKETGSYRINGLIGLVSGAYAFRGDDATYVSLKLTTERDVEDEEFDRLFDEYDAGIYDGLDYVKQLAESEDCYNPEWEMLLEFSEDDSRMEQRLNNILGLHKKELDRILCGNE